MTNKINADVLHLNDNDLTGDLDPIFCHSNGGSEFSHDIVSFISDCGGDDPEIICTCCSECCIDGEDCEPNNT